MTDHNDIFNDKVQTFILLTIDNIVRRSLISEHLVLDKKTGETLPAPILSKPRQFEKRFREIYSTLQKQ
jgi:hypothetical protein